MSLYGEKHKNNTFMNTEEKAMQTCMLLHAFALPFLFPKNYGQEVGMNYFQHTELTLSRLRRGLWTMSKIESLARALPRFILVVSSSDTLLVVSTLDMAQDCHLRPFYRSWRG